MVVAFKIIFKGLVWFLLFKVVVVIVKLSYGDINQFVLTHLKQSVEPFHVCHECHKFNFRTMTWVRIVDNNKPTKEANQN